MRGGCFLHHDFQGWMTKLFVTLILMNPIRCLWPGCPSLTLSLAIALHCRCGKAFSIHAAVRALHLIGHSTLPFLSLYLASVQTRTSVVSPLAVSLRCWIVRIPRFLEKKKRSLPS